MRQLIAGAGAEHGRLQYQRGYGHWAFAVLTRTSQQGNIKLREVADQLVRTGSLPGT